MNWKTLNTYFNISAWILTCVWLILSIIISIYTESMIGDTLSEKSDFKWKFNIF